MASVFNPIKLLPILGYPNNISITVSHSHNSLIFQNLTLNINLHSLYSQSQLSSLSSLNLSLVSLCSQSQVSSLNSQPLTPYPPPPRIHSFPNPSWPPRHHHSTVTGSRLHLTFHHGCLLMLSCSRISFLVSRLLASNIFSSFFIYLFLYFEIWAFHLALKLHVLDSILFCLIV